MNDFGLTRIVLLQNAKIIEHCIEQWVSGVALPAEAIETLQEQIELMRACHDAMVLKLPPAEQKQVHALATQCENRMAFLEELLAKKV